MVNLEAVPPDVRAHLLGALPHAFAANRSRAKGLGWGIAFLVIFLLALWFRGNGVRHDGYKLYAPTPFIAFGILGWLTAMPIVAWVRMRRSLARAPLQGVFLSGANIVVATERALTVFPFAQTQVARGGTLIALTCMGNTFSFAFPDGRALQVEQQLKHNANALAHAQHYNDQQTAMALDPFAFVQPHPAPRSARGAALLALPIALLTIPVIYLYDRHTDDAWYEGIRPDSYEIDYYKRSHGRHVEELRIKVCELKLAVAETPPAIRMAVTECPDFEPKAKEKLDNIYVKTRAQLEWLPEKIRPVLLELLDASRAGVVGATLVVHGPTHAELAGIDKLLDKAKLTDIMHLADSFDPEALSARETQIRDMVIEAINKLGPSETFRVAEDKAATTGLTIALTYSLGPLVKGNDVIVYRETGASSLNRRFLGLRIHIGLTLASRAGAKYDVDLDAEPANQISHETMASNKTIYNKLVDSALDDASVQLKTKMFPELKK